MNEPDYKRVYHCLRIWIKEIKEPFDKDEDEEPYTHEEAVSWIVNTCEEEILNGDYLDDDEYNEILLGYEK